MPNWLFFILFLAGALFGMLHGALMMFSPPRHRKLVLRMSDPFGWSKLRIAEDNQRQGWQAQYRLSGLGILLISSCFAWIAIRNLAVHYWLTVDGSVHIAPLLISLFFFLAGMTMIAKPHFAYKLAVRDLHLQVSSLPSPSQIEKGMRLMGGLILFVTAIFVTKWVVR